MTFLSPRLRTAVVAAFVLSMALCGCSAKSAPSPAPSTSSTGEAAARVCDALLSGQAAPALERLTGAQHFSESSLTAGEKVRGLAQAEKALLGDSSFSHRGTEFDLCLPRATDELTGGTLTISTQWLYRRPGDYTWTSQGEWTAFDILGGGEKDVNAPYASASSKTSWFAFRCPKGPGSGKNTVLTVNITTTGLQGNHDDRAAEDLTLIGYGTSLKLAKKMDCLKESRLPEKLAALKKFT